MVNFSGDSKYHHTILWLADIELKQGSIQKSARQQHMLGKSKGLDGGREGGRESMKNDSHIWNQAQKK